jgi:carbonic anhydrase
VDPVVIFDQTLGDVFVSRVPGNVASDGAKWIKVPLVVVLGHSGCLAVQSVVDWKVGGTGGFLRMHVLPSVMRAEGLGAEKLANAVRLNALHTIEQLLAESPAARIAAHEGRTAFIAAHYDLGTGSVSEIQV